MVALRNCVKSAALVLALAALPGCAGTISDSKALQPGSAESRRITDLPVDAAGSSAPVVVAPEVLHGFTFLYQYVDETEFVLCLEGNQSKGRIYVTGFRLAILKKTTIGSASYEPCRSRNYIGTAHNHPPVQQPAALCAQSIPDRNSFNDDARALVDIILCGDTRYLWVLKDGRSDVDDGMTRLRQLLARRLH